MHRPLLSIFLLSFSLLFSSCLKAKLSNTADPSGPEGTTLPMILEGLGIKLPLFGSEETEGESFSGAVGGCVIGTALVGDCQL